MTSLLTRFPGDGATAKEPLDEAAGTCCAEGSRVERIAAEAEPVRSADARSSFGSAALREAALTGAAAAVFTAVVSTRVEGVLRPFVWVDLAAVQIFAAWPLARLLRSLSSSRAWQWLLAALGLGVAFLLASASPETFRGGAVQRGVEGLAIACVASVLAAAAVRAGAPSGDHRPSWRTALACVAAAAVGVALPAVYAVHQSDQCLARVAILLPELKTDVAGRCASDVLALRPELEYDGRPLRETAGEIAEYLRTARETIATTDVSQLSPAEQLRHAGLLAQTGARDAAASLAETLLQRADTAPGAALLLGMLSDERRAWEMSLQSYTRAKDLLSENPARLDDLVRAWDGIARAEDERHNPAAAENAYHASLLLAPSAGTNLQLARFYAAHHRLSDARRHAEAAVRLDPAAASRAQALLDSMALHSLCRGSERGR